jgi:hypothetical protein
LDVPKPVFPYLQGTMATERHEPGHDPDSAPTRSSILLRAVVAYLVIGAALAQGSLLVIRAVGLSPVLFEAVLVLLFLGLPVVVVGIMALEGRFGVEAADHALQKSAWTSAPMVLILGAVVLLAGAGGWDMLPGPLNPLGPGAAQRASLGFLPPRVVSQHPADASHAGALSRRVRSALAGASGLTLLPDSLVDLYRTPTSQAHPPAVFLQETFERAESGVVLAIEVLDARTGESLWEGAVEGPPDGEPGGLSEEAISSEMEELIAFLEERLGLELPEIRTPD